MARRNVEERGGKHKEMSLVVLYLLIDVNIVSYHRLQQLVTI